MCYATIVVSSFALVAAVSAFCWPWAFGCQTAHDHRTWRGDRGYLCWDIKVGSPWLVIGPDALDCGCLLCVLSLLGMPARASSLEVESEYGCTKLPLWRIARRNAFVAQTRVGCGSAASDIWEELN